MGRGLKEADTGRVKKDKIATLLEEIGRQENEELTMLEK